MSKKVFFAGNILGGDDGIGIFLYEKLKDEAKLVDYKLYDVGTMGIDVLSFVNESDSIIFVDSLKTNKPGVIKVFYEEDLDKNIIVNQNIISPHDFGIAETIKLIRSFHPNIPKMKIIGVGVKNIESFKKGLSFELIDNIESIKTDVIFNILN